MRAIVRRRLGGPEVLAFADQAEPWAELWAEPWADPDLLARRATGKITVSTGIE